MIMRFALSHVIVHQALPGQTDIHQCWNPSWEPYKLGWVEGWVGLGGALQDLAGEAGPSTKSREMKISLIRVGG